MADDPSEYTLLVVDDIEENRDLLARRLRKRDYRILEAEDGPTALALVEKEAVDLILLDIMMPGMSGLEVLRTVRETYSDDDLPVIMVTAKTESDDVVSALDAGANDYVTKPIDFPIVLARVKTQLRMLKPRRQRAAEAAANELVEAVGQSEFGPGSIVADKYQLTSLVGAGAFGSVYRAKHLDLESQVAVKLLQAKPGASESDVTRFHQEGISTCRVRHPNAVQVFDFGVAPNGTAYLVMEMLDGLSLQEQLELDGAMTPRRAVEILVPVCEVLHTAHAAGIIHRDIKPSNIFLHETPAGEVIKVLDFGIAKIAGSEAMGRSLTLQGTVLGTPAYMAPERFLDRPYDGRSDVYSVGITLFMLLEANLPFFHETDAMAVAMAHIQRPPPPLARCHPAARAEMQRIVDAVLQKRPEQRPDAEALARELEHTVRTLGGAADQPPLVAASPLDTMPDLTLPSDSFSGDQESPEK